MTMYRCKNVLGIVWLAGFLIPFLVLTMQTIAGYKYDKPADVWEWFLPTTLPTVALMLGVFVIDAANKSVQDSKASGFLFALAVTFSVVYLLAVNLMFFWDRGIALSDPTRMSQSNLFLAPLQGLVSALLGVFFVNKSRPVDQSAPQTPSQAAAQRSSS